MVIRQSKHFNLQQICDSGQCFRMERVSENCYRVIAFGRSLEILQEGEQCTFFCTPHEFEEIWNDYFDLETDYQSYIEGINPNDSYLLAAAEWGSGIRILRQDLWEMIASFLISQQNHITRIRKSIQNLCETYGEERTSDSGNTFYTFPEPEKLAELGMMISKHVILDIAVNTLCGLQKVLYQGKWIWMQSDICLMQKQRKSC